MPVSRSIRRVTEGFKRPTLTPKQLIKKYSK